MVVDGIQKDLQLSLGLHEGPHDAERSDGLPIFRQKAGNDGVIRLFSGPDSYRWPYPSKNYDLCR